MIRSRATDIVKGKPRVSSDGQGMIAGLAVVVMAAGLGKRMRSKQAKVLHRVASSGGKSKELRKRLLDVSKV